MKRIGLISPVRMDTCWHIGGFGRICPDSIPPHDMNWNYFVYVIKLSPMASLVEKSHNRLVYWFPLAYGFRSAPATEIWPEVRSGYF
jgi:hypothetical protein